MNMTAFFIFLSSFFPLGITEMQSKVCVSKILEVKQGENLTVVMNSNPPTGYVWIWDKTGQSGNVDSVGHKYEKLITGLAAYGGIETWTFKAIAKGTTVLKFCYVRPWDIGRPAQSKEVVVVVN